MGMEPWGVQGPQPLSQKHQHLHTGVEEEEETSFAAFHNAFEEAKTAKLRVPGLQEYAASLWERRRRIPSMSSDPLMHMFMEFDVSEHMCMRARV